MDQLRARLLRKSDSLTRSELRIAEWLEANFERLAFLTVNEVSRETGVSEATIVRFARKLEYVSYSAFQDDVQGAVQQQYSVGNRLAALLDQPESPLARAYKQDLENLQRTYELLDHAVFEGAVRAIAHAPRIGIVGLRASAGAALYLAFALNLIRPGVTQLRADSENLHDQLLDLVPGDVVIAVSLAKPTRKTLEVVREARDRYGATIIAIASSSVSALAQMANHVLVVGSEGTFNSYAATFSLAGALLDAVATRLHDSAAARIARLDVINADNVYSG